MARYGVDIGGTKIETAIFDDHFNLLDSWRVNTPTNDYALFLNTINAQIIKADEITGEQCSLGIGMPGLINHHGKVLSANIPCATNKDIAQDLNTLLNRPISIKNDTRCFALSEATLGAGKHHSRVFGAIIGTGAAGGLCINGKLEQTTLGIAGEYGHIPLSAQLQQKYQLPIFTCGCGLTGCVESYIAGPGINRLYQHFTGKTETAIYWHQQLKLKDKTAKKILDCYLDILSETFATLIKVQEPDIIVLGGGLSLVDDIVTQLPEVIKRHLFPGFPSPKIVAAQFGDSSGVRGAAILGSLPNES
ncbi:ROK family protein [Thalassotalea sp. 1_MG-2023]|uniref:ROK family protein n=1 Tax=Thalassotalea sp. 1_MG-2023 TaxID=3062680 RepID=UPI0026E2C647|nr:ROK family protein [Thalassotalea sp. 1_MG-2023]MDO6428665.1 ROK family protein [Thalassotalea sp. 1_MG-2023]